jgi:putative thioredoxin
MWKWIVGGVVLVGLLVCVGGAGGLGWWFWQSREAELAARASEIAVAEASARAVEESRVASERVRDRLGAARRAVEAGDHAAAVDAFGDVLELEPEHPEARLGRGRAYARLERLDLAEEDLRVAVRLDPRSKEGWEALAWVLGQGGRDIEAVEALDQLLALDDRNARAWRDRANARYRGGDVRSAREDAARACALGLADACTLEERIRDASGGR